MSDYRAIIEHLAREHWAPEEQLVALIERPEQRVLDYAAGVAREIASQHFGHRVYLRGLLEISNVCARGCYYCGLRAENREVERYTLTEDMIVESCERGYSYGLRSFVMQGGERGDYKEWIERTVRRCKGVVGNGAITLSLGEQSRECYELWRKAGADRYLLRHETASAQLYQELHPASMEHSHRLHCLDVLAELGYQRGAGFMVGTPGQSAHHLAQELPFLRQMAPEMVGIGPFMPQSSTPFAGKPRGGVEQTLLMISLVRMVLPKALMPSTTALATASGEGTQRGVLAGANVVMPNITPMCYREAYAIYDGKKSSGTEAMEGLERLADELHAIGYEASFERGDHPDFGLAEGGVASRTKSR